MQSNEPYIGSVRFFKNIIFLCCILGVLIPTGLALRWRSRAKTAESLLAQNAVVLTGEEDEAASEAEAASVETEPEADSSDEQEPLSYQLLYPDFYAPTPCRTSRTPARPSTSPSMTAPPTAPTRC